VYPSPDLKEHLVKTVNPSFAALLDDIGQACKTVLRGCVQAAKYIATLPWPALLLASILLAFVLTIVPLALVLFVVFLVVKLAVGVLVIDKQRQRRD
jgi:hypothetical protein